jgi:hypothetical protein
MFKKSILVTIVLSLILVSGCSKTNYIRSRPVGYILLSSEYVARSSLLYDSQAPFNINELTLERFALPAIWAELDLNDAQNVVNTDENFIIIEGDTRRVFIKKVMIDQTVWTAELVGGVLIYKNELDLSFETYLNNEETVKSYIEALEMEQAYFLDHTGAMLFGYLSLLEKTSEHTPYQKMNEATKIMINYENQLSAFPDLASYFNNYMPSKINLLFQNAYARRNMAEYKFEEYTA